MAIRQAKPEDADDIARIHVQSWRDAYAGTVPKRYLDRLSIEQRQERWSNILAQSSDGTIVITDSRDRVVGWASFGPSRDNDGEGKGELYAIYLISANWGQGYGRRLLASVENRLKEMGISNITLWVFEQNDRARYFYEQAGYLYDGTRKMIVIDDVDLIELRYGK